MAITAQDTKLKQGFMQTEVGVVPQDWDVQKLRDVVSKVIDNRGKTPPYSSEAEIELIETASISFVGQYPDYSKVTKFVTKYVHDNWFRDHPLRGDVLISTVGEYSGSSAIMRDTRGTIAQNLIALRIKNLDPFYVFYWTRSASYNFQKKQVMMNQAQPSLRVPWLLGFNIASPRQKIEQAAIATALSDTDALIEYLEKLIAKKKDIKQATMQQLFTGKTRLLGFSGEWKEKRFGEIFQFLNTANNSRSDLSENGEIKYIHYGDIHMKWRSFLDCSSDELPLIQSDKVRNVPLLEDGDLVMADASEDLEGIGISVEVKNATSTKVVAGLHTFLLRGDNEVLAQGFKGYLQYIPAVKESLKKAATGISVYGISKNNVRNISICLPDITEQRAIAIVLSDMDAELAALEQKRDKTRALKQGMMQELLTGKTRLV